MSGRSTPGAERRAWNRLIASAFVLVVGASAAMIAVAGGATPVETAVVAVAGLATGGILAYYLSTLSAEREGRREYRGR
jgi:membrane protein implicated in regulation of membrane protease activity